MFMFNPGESGDVPRFRKRSFHPLKPTQNSSCGSFDDIIGAGSYITLETFEDAFGTEVECRQSVCLALWQLQKTFHFRQLCIFFANRLQVQKFLFIFAMHCDGHTFLLAQSHVELALR